jgi:hypothetical protein
MRAFILAKTSMVQRLVNRRQISEVRGQMKTGGAPLCGYQKPRTLNL